MFARVFYELSGAARLRGQALRAIADNALARIADQVLDLCSRRDRLSAERIAAVAHHCSPRGQSLPPGARFDFSHPSKERYPSLERYAPNGPKRLSGRQARTLRVDAPARVRTFGPVPDGHKQELPAAHVLRLQQKLADANCISAASEVSYAIIHELSQPLSATLINAQIAQRLLAENHGGPEMRETLSDIVAEARRAAEVIRELRGPLRRQTLKSELLDLNALIREILELVRGQSWLPNGQITFHPDPGLPKLAGDRIQIQQVLLNLIQAAVQAMADAPPQERIIAIQTARRGAGIVCVEIRDTGPSLGEEELSRLFEPNYTRANSGFSLGLTISRSIIKRHQGDIWAEHNPDRGITVCVTLPCVTSGNKAARP